MRARILNRSGKIPADGWYQIEVAGEHPVSDGRIQVIDEPAMKSIVNRFKQEAAAVDDFPGLLTDADHLSHDMDKTTEAYAWAKDLEIRDGQLHAQLDLTDLGAPAVTSKRYKFFSTEYDPEDLEDLGGGRWRPLRLAGLAFTNRPNNRGAKPISNRSGAQPDGSQKPTETNTPPMKNIATKLGLPAEADEAAILAKIQSLLDQVKTMGEAEASTQADAIMNRFGDRIPKEKQADVRQRLITNRADTVAMLELLPDPPQKKEAQQRIHNRETSTTPAPVGDGAGDAENAAEVKKAAAIRNRAGEIARKQNIPFNRAFGLAQAELS